MRSYHFYLIFLLSIIFLFSGCQNKEMERLTEQVSQLGRQNHDLRRQLDQSREPAQRLELLSGYLNGVKARINTNMGAIEVEFYPEKAPIHVFNFISRAEGGFYNNTQFHRVIPGFMIQGGDPNSRDGNKLNNGQGGPISMIPHEFNDIRHERGVLSMARVGDKSAGAGSQFFIMHADRFHLDNEYTPFGRVTSGMDVVDRIAATEKHTDDPRLRDHPVNPVIIQSVDLFR
jgi:cyclophilin family peptidyl-prolyl cis-trans isomerase